MSKNAYKKLHHYRQVIFVHFLIINIMNKRNFHNIEKFYTIKKLSEQTGVSENLIRFWKFQKKIPFVQERPGSAVLIPYSEFLEFLELNKNAAKDRNR